jgi:hypothetical protein
MPCSELFTATIFFFHRLLKYKRMPRQGGKEDMQYSFKQLILSTPVRKQASRYQSFGLRQTEMLKNVITTA